MNGWIGMVSKVGFPVVVSLALLYFVITTMRDQVTHLTEAHERIEAMVNNHINSTRGTRLLLQLICQNTATNSLQRSDCARAVE